MGRAARSIFPRLARGTHIPTQTPANRRRRSPVRPYEPRDNGSPPAAAIRRRRQVCEPTLPLAVTMARLSPTGQPDRDALLAARSMRDAPPSAGGTRRAPHDTHPNNAIRNYWLKSRDRAAGDATPEPSCLPSGRPRSVRPRTAQHRRVRLPADRRLLCSAGQPALVNGGWERRCLPPSRSAAQPLRRYRPHGKWPINVKTDTKPSCRVGLMPAGRLLALRGPSRRPPPPAARH